MGEIILAEKLDRKELRELSEVYIHMWGGVLQNEFLHLSSEDLVDEIVKQWESRIERFSSGQIVYRTNDKIIGGISAIMVSARKDEEPDWDKVPKTWNGLTSNGYFINHDKEGNLLVCCAISVLEGYKDEKAPRKLLHEETKFAAENGLIACPYTRPSGFGQWLEKEKYLERKEDYETLAPEKLTEHLNFYLTLKDSNGRLICVNPALHENYGAETKRILYKSRPKDYDSAGFCMLMAYSEGHIIPLEKAVGV